VHSQFRRAKERIDAPDLELYEDLLSVYNQSNDVDTEPGVLHTLCEKLMFMEVEDIKQESLALQEMASSTDEDLEESVKKMSILLKKIENYVKAEYCNTCPCASNNCSLHCSGQGYTDQCSQSPVIPDDFRCPISLELMKDPVIICTGQVCA
jgi:hypothetical protein